MKGRCSYLVFSCRSSTRIREGHWDMLPWRIFHFNGILTYEIAVAISFVLDHILALEAGYRCLASYF